MKKKIKTIIFTIMDVLLFVSIFYFVNNRPHEERPYGSFMESVSEGDVESIDISMDSDEFEYTLKTGVTYITDNPKYSDFKKEMLEAGIKVNEKINPSEYFSGLLNILMFAGMGFCLVSMYMMSTGKELFFFRDKESYLSEVTFNDVAGHQELKKDLQGIIDFIKNPDSYKEAGAKLPKGVLLYGPPGTGKTLLAKAIAGEAGVNFRAVSGSDFDEKFVGVGASRIRELFKWAKENSPCILFIDEIDSLGSRRDSNISGDRQTINALLSEMDGFIAGNGVVVIAATNRLQDLDPALTRPGRFDNRFAVPLPSTTKERMEIINIYIKNKKLDESVNLEAFAKEMIGSSPAVIEAIINDAAIIAARESNGIITKEMLDEATLKQLVQGHSKKGVERKQDEIKITAWHEAGHALIGCLTGQEVTKVSIVPTTSGAGGMTLFNRDKMGLYTKEELEAQIMTLFAGRIAEELKFGKKKITTGASNDIEAASRLIYDMVTEYGMGVTLLSYSIIHADEKTVMDEIETYAEKLNAKTTCMMKSHIEQLDAIAEKLIENETINGKEINRIVYI